MKKTNKKSNAQNGITLIALVITIIVLLILAGVAINMAIDSDGLFGKANEAVSKWNSSVEEEEEAIQSLLNTLEEQTKEKTLVDLYEAGELKIGDYVEYNPIATGDTGAEEDYTYTVLDENVGYTEEKTENVTPTSSINMPDDVEVMLTSTDLTSTIPEEQTYTVNTETKWRVLGVEGEGANKHILLISADPIRNAGEETNYLVMAGANSYVNGPTELNNISAIYGHGDGATGARSVKIEDINKITGVTVSSTGLTPDVDQGGVYGNSYYFEGHYTPESWLGDQTTGTVSGTCDGYFYSGDAEGLQTNTTTNQKTGARLYEMIFGDTDTKYFWLASRGVRAGSSNAFFGPGAVVGGGAYSCGDLFDSDGYEGVASAGVRPVVSLESGITEATVKIIEDQPRENWAGQPS